MTFKLKQYKILVVFLIFLFYSNVASIYAQGMPNNPREILKIWDYYILTEKLGEGTPIVDSMAGQAYISGMQYQENWFGKNAVTSYIFSDIDVNSLKLRFWSANVAKRTDGKISNVTDPVIRDSLLREFQFQDSLRVDSVNRILQMNPNLIASMQSQSDELNAQAKGLYDLDSLRCDSLIIGISNSLGSTLWQDTTTHPETARYTALWIENGMAVSLKDFTNYTDVVFSIPTIKETDAVKFGLNGAYEVYKKLLLQVEDEEIEISLTVLPIDKTISDFNGVGLMAHNSVGQADVQQVSNNKLITNPTIYFEDFNNDKLQEIWIKYDLIGDPVRRAHKIYSYEENELVLIFDSDEEIIEGIAPRLLHGFQIEVTFADGSKFLYPVEKSAKAIQGKYNSTGVLKGDDLIIADNIKYLKTNLNQATSEMIMEGKISLIVASNSLPIGDILVHWKYDSGYWVILDYQIIDQ